MLDAFRHALDLDKQPRRGEQLFSAPEFSGPAASGSTISFSGVEKRDFRGLVLGIIPFQ
jgi:hypothetical protein